MQCAAWVFPTCVQHAEPAGQGSHTRPGGGHNCGTSLQPAIGSVSLNSSEANAGVGGRRVAGSLLGGKQQDGRGDEACGTARRPVLVTRSPTHPTPPTFTVHRTPSPGNIATSTVATHLQDGRHLDGPEDGHRGPSQRRQGIAEPGCWIADATPAYAKSSPILAMRQSSLSACAVDAVQRAVRERQGPGGELPVLHHRAQRGRGRRAG